MNRRQYLQTVTGTAAGAILGAPQATAQESASGDQQWTFQAGGEITHSPAVADGTVYVSSRDNYLYALDAATGAQQWAQDLGPPGEGSESPTVAYGTVYLPWREAIFALDAATGEQQWVFDFGGFASSPTVVSGSIYFTGSDDTMYALDAATGERQWWFSSVPSFSPPAVVDGTVYVFGSGGRDEADLYALNSTTGDEQWAFGPFENGLAYYPYLANRTVYATTYDTPPNATLVAVNATTGALRWASNSGGSPATAAAVGDGSVYYGAASELYAFDWDHGQQQWTSQLGRDITSTPAVADGTVYVTSDSQLAAVDGATGTQRWTFETESEVRTSPTVSNGTIYVGTRDGTLYAVRATQDGRLILDGERFSILSTAQRGEGEFSYRIVVVGDAVPIREGANSADPGDSVTETADGVVITGSTGSGAGDAFRVTGEILSVTITGSDEYRLELAGEDVTDAVSE